LILGLRALVNINLRHIPALVLILLLDACGPKDARRPPPIPEAGFVVMQAQSVPLMIELAGRTSAYETSEVRPQVSGVIKARNFVEGGLVRQGQTLYEIDPSLYRAAAAQAQANLQNAEASREAAVAKAARYRPLADIEAVSKQDYTDAAAAARQAAAAVAQTRAALETANINLRFTRVPAPISGRIGRSMVTTGALVTSGQAGPLTSIQRLDPIFVDIQQSSSDLVALRRSLGAGARSWTRILVGDGPATVGDGAVSGGATPSSAAVRLTLEDGSPYPLTGKMEFAEAVVDQNTGTVTLRATFPNPQGLLLPGMFVRAQLSQATATNAILAPQQAVSRDPRGAATVMLVGADDRAVLQPVTAAHTVGDSWLITSGLKSGDRVITEGLDRIKPGQKVRPVPAGSATGASPGGRTGAGLRGPR
jgi:membrane fusion protein (multidrug efflux system)